MSSIIDRVFTFNCNYCSFCSYDKLTWIKHFFQAHSGESTFSYVCGITSCLHEFRVGSTFASFLTHCNRKHVDWRDKLAAEISTVEPRAEFIEEFVADDEEMDLTSIQADDDGDSFADLLVASLDTDDISRIDTQMATAEDVEAVAARFLLILKEKYRVTQASLDFAVDSVSEILQLVTNNIKQAVFNKLSEHGTTLNGDEILSEFKQDSPFTNLKTEYQQTKFYKENFGYIVSTCNITNIIIIIKCYIFRTQSLFSWVLHIDTSNVVPLVV